MTNNLILVTGASSDIGLALIRRLLSAPEPPTILAHSYTGGSSIQELKSEFGDLVQPLQADFTKSTEVSAMADLITNQYGVPNRIVHMPALQVIHERFSKFPWDQFKRDMDVQVHSAMILLQRFLPKMAKMPGARVVFMLSFVTQGLPPKFMSYYTIVKYAELGVMRALAAEYASSCVRINGISPSTVETKFLRKVSDVAVQMAASASPLGRNATPQDLIGALEFLLSAGAEYMTGIDIPITAGSTC
jgi:3-oxoacyl-[acyl-carrier protein] reductase